MMPLLALSVESVASTAMVVFGIGFLIFIHELGHFMAAKAAGVRVHAFAIGMGPRVFGWQRGDTDYKVCLLPIGGYVRMHGEVPGEGDVHDPGSLTSKSVAWRFLIFSGGVIMNVLFALVAFPIIFSSGVAFTAPILGEVEEGGAAWQAGLREGDRVLAVDDNDLYSFEQLTLESALAGAEPLAFQVRRGDDSFVAQVAPLDDVQRGAKTIGIGPAYEAEPRLQLRGGAESPAARAGLLDGDILVTIDGEAATQTAYDAWSRRLMVDPSSAARSLRVGVRRGEEAAVEHFDLTPTFVDGPQRLGVARISTRVAGLRRASKDDAEAARIRQAIDATGLLVGDVIVAARDTEGRLRALDRPETLHELLATSAVKSFEVLRVAALAKSRDDAKQVSLAVDARLLGPGGAASFRNAVGLGPDEISGHVFVQSGLGAERAGMRTGDRIVAIDDVDIFSFQDVIRVVTQAREAERKTLNVRWLPLEGLVEPLEPRSASVALEAAKDADYGFIAQFRPLQETYRTQGILASLSAGWHSSVDNLRKLYLTLKRMIGGSVSATNLGGIITISVVSYSYANSGWERFVWFLAFLSLNLAFINVLPIPVLDGGHLLFLLIEKIKGSPVSVRVMTYAQVLGIVFVLGLLIFVTFNDIARLLQ